MKNIILALICKCIIVIKVNAQNVENPITTAVPFQLITPDARAAAMGNVGVATSVDAFSQHHNPAQYAFLEQKHILGLSHTPWFLELVNDVFLANIVYGNKINERSAWSTSFKYFTFGDIEITDENKNYLGIDKPNEFSLDGTYALKLSKNFSSAITLRYIRSDFELSTSDNVLNVVSTFSTDVSGYYQSKEISYNSFKGIWRGGFSISNMGPKISYSDAGTEYFIPTNLKLGVGFDFIFNKKNTLTLSTEFSKHLVPTPPITDVNGNIIKGLDNNVSFFEGVFQSFSDAPNGFNEEISEVTYALGMEYGYNNILSFRSGYYGESDLKGGIKYVTLGTGIKIGKTLLDVSYLFNVSESISTLTNTIRFSISFEFGTSLKTVKK